MHNIIKDLSVSEQEIMNTFWDNDKSLTKTEIINLTTDKTWKASSIHILLNSLLKKGAIAEDGFARTATNITRTFKPLYSRKDYAVSQIKKVSSDGKLSVPDIFASLISANVDMEDLKEIENIVNAKRKELE